MDYIETQMSGPVALVKISRGKVNALTHELIKELTLTFQNLEADPDVGAVVLSGKGSFFSFGFDIPVFLSYSKNRFAEFLKDFTTCYSIVFGFSKPVIAAINGHAVAGGCMLALACDVRFMTDAKAKISLNEINFGAALLAGSVEMLQFWIGSRQAQQMVFSGEMYTAEEARAKGLVDRIIPAKDLEKEALGAATDLARKIRPAFAKTKDLLRRPVLESMRSREPESIADFMEIWYSPETWSQVQKIVIR